MSEAAFRLDIGEYKCVIVSDGTLVSGESESAETFSLNCLCIESASHKILIDTGCGENFQATAGRLLNNLKAAGINAADIDKIIFTHGHIDHAAGTYSAAGKPSFPNARYIVLEKEWRYWETKPGENELQNMFFSPARKYLLPARDRFDLVKDDFEVLPGIKLIAAPGHTPGNIMVDISSENKRLLCIGDIIHSQREFINPECLTSFDVTPEQALTTRERILTDVAKSGTHVFACHFPFPGLGYIRRHQGVFAWRPI
jgi:glyoxylase-like metal-dependent hydrolase (beta-lactamase superfamily II)